MSALRKACRGHSPRRHLTYRKLDFWGAGSFWERVLEPSLFAGFNRALNVLARVPVAIANSPPSPAAFTLFFLAAFAPIDPSPGAS